MAHDHATLLEKARQLVANGDDLESVLALFRQSGCSKIESIRALMDLKAIPLREAKQIVHLSRTWKDTLQADDRLHDELQTAAESLGKKPKQRAARR